MFERYDESARRVIFFARFEAGTCGATEIDTEHLLLGLFRQDQVLLDRVAGSPIEVELIRQAIKDRTGGAEMMAASADMPLSEAAKRVLLEHVGSVEYEHIGTEHILLGLLTEDCLAAEILNELGLTIEKVRNAIAEVASRSASGELGPLDPAADRVMVFAQYEASALGTAEVNAEHLLLGLIRQDPGLLHRLTGAYFSESVLPAIRTAAGRSGNAPAKRVLAHALDEANLLNHGQIGVEHLLLGLLHEETSTAAQLFRGMGLSVEKVREDLANGTDRA